MNMDSMTESSAMRANDEERKTDAGRSNPSAASRLRPGDY